MKKLLLLLFLFSSFEYLNAENGYDLWLRYKTIDNKQLLHLYRQQITGLTIHGSSPTITAAKEELSLGLQGLLQIKIPFTSGTHQKGTVLAGTLLSFYTATWINFLPPANRLRGIYYND